MGVGDLLAVPARQGHGIGEGGGVRASSRAGSSQTKSGGLFEVMDGEMVTAHDDLPVVVALLSGDDRRDGAIREALSRLESRASIMATADASEAQAAAGGTEAVCVLDAVNHELSIESFLRELGDVARTLAVLCDDLLDAAVRSVVEATGTEAPGEESPRVLARAPSLFKSRVLYTEACRYVESVLADAVAGRKPKVAEARILAERIHTSLLQSNRLLLMALEPYDRFELPPHCANVALLAGKITMGLGWGVDGVLRAIQAGLLHDIGMARLPERVLLKAGKLSEDEWELVRQHPDHGAEIIGRLGEAYEWLRLAVVQEHERMNGQGYPEGLSGEEIDGLARVIAVADVFEAFSHPRTYRSLFTSYEALEQVVGLRDESLSGDVVAALVDEISAFPLDSFVMLSTGEIGRVVHTNPTNLMRPVVQTVWNPLWQPVDEPRTLNLAEETAVSVTRPLHETELPIT
jgi:HD-GYP domain-containing protein (c-di-GMP phosphodiesterase class II)